MLTSAPYPDGIEHLTFAQVDAMLEQGELSPSLWVRRDTLVALAELAALARNTHDPLSRWRMKKFRATLAEIEANDEVEVTGETLCETALLALTYLASRK